MPTETTLALAATAAALALKVMRADQPPDQEPAPGAEEENTFDLPDGTPIGQELLHWFREQSRAVLGTIPEIGTELPDHYAALTNYDDPMAASMTPLLSAYWDESGRRARAKLGLDPEKWQVTSPHLRPMIEEAALDFCRATNETTSLELTDALNRLRKELIEGLVDSGESIPQLRKRVQSVFQDAKDYRAERIARTEASRAVHAAQLESDAESGVVAGHEWLLSGDACSRCQQVAAEAKRVRLRQPFAVVGNHPAYATVRHPPLHVSCRCALRAVLKPEYGGPEEPGWAATTDGLGPVTFGWTKSACVARAAARQFRENVRGDD